MKIDIGKRIRFYRQRVKMTQLELEMQAGMSPGALSKIESNQTDPTKETIRSIADTLNLSHEELDYLIGKTASPATEEEIRRAKEEASVVLSKRGKLAYLLDERWRFVMVSDTFLKLLKAKQSEIDYVIGKTTAQLIVRKDSPVLERIDGKHYDELLQTYLPYYFSQISHMDDDETYQATVRDIMANDRAKEIWQGLTYEKDKKYRSQEDRFINFNVLGIKFSLYYSMQPLAINSRFQMIEYTTKNLVLDLLPKLI